MKNFKLIIILVLILSGCVTNKQDSIKEVSIVNKKKEITHLTNEIWDLIYSNNYETAGQKLDNALIKHSNNTEDISQLLRIRGLLSYILEDNQDTFDKILQGLEENTLSPYIVEIANFLLKNSLYDTKRRDKLISKIETISEHKKTPYWLKNEINYILHNYYFNITGDLSKAILIKKRMNLIENWEFIGPFSNISNSGYNYDFVQFTNKEDVTIEKENKGIFNWDTQMFNPPNKTLEALTPISTYFSNLNNVSLYAYKTIKITKTENYQFIISKKGSVEFWINDEKLIENNNYHGGNNIFYINKMLEEGEHKILIKISNKESSSNFNVAYSIAEDKNQVKNTLYKELFPNKKYFDPYLNSLCKEIESGSSKEGYFWLINALANKGWFKESKQLLKVLKDQYIDSNFLLFIEANIYEKEGKIVDSTRIRTKLFEQEPPFVPSVKHAIRDYISMNRLHKAEDYLDKLKENYPNWYYTHHGELQVLLEIGSKLQINDKLDDLLITYPGIFEPNHTYINYSYNLSYNELLNNINLIKSKDNYKYGLYRTFKFYQNSGDQSLARRDLYSYIQNYASSDYLWAEYIGLLFSDRTLTLDKLKSTVNNACESYPYSTELLNVKKDIYQSYLYFLLNSNNVSLESDETFEQIITSQNNKEIVSATKEYKDTLERILQLTPFRYDVRFILTRLNDKEHLFDEFERKDSYDLIQRFEKKNKEYNSDAVVVYDYKKNIYYGDGASTQYAHLIIKVLTDKGIEYNRFINLGFNPRYNKIYEAFTLKEDGSRIPVDISGSEVAFPNMDKGDYIVLSYIADYFNYDGLNEEIHERVVLKDYYPIRERFREIIYPEDKELNFKYNNVDSNDVKHLKGKYKEGYNKIKYTLRDVEAQDFTPLSPQIRDVLPSIDISTIKSWEKITEWYKKLYIGQTEVTEDIQKKSDELCKSLDRNIDKVKSIFNFVAHHIEYEDLSFQYDNFIPQTAQSVLDEGYGDCKDQSALLISLLKAAGIESYMSLNATYYAGKNPFIPSNVFDHVLVAVLIDGEKIYLDPTLTNYTFGEMPAERNGTLLLDVKEESQAIYSEYNNDINKSFILLECKNIDSTPIITGSKTYSGDESWYIRDSLKDSTQEKANNIIEGEISTWLKGFELTSFDHKNMDNIIYSPNIEFSGTSSPLVQKLNGSISKINIPWQYILGAEELYCLSVDGESFSINNSKFNTPKSQVIIIDLPENSSTISLPKSKRVKFMNNIFEISYKQENNKIICEKNIYIPIQTIDQNNINKFKQFIEIAYDLENSDFLIREDL